MRLGRRLVEAALTKNNNSSSPVTSSPVTVTAADLFSKSDCERGDDYTKICEFLERQTGLSLKGSSS